jgi:hypothetical protein
MLERIMLVEATMYDVVIRIKGAPEGTGMRERRICEME